MKHCSTLQTSLFPPMLRNTHALPSWFIQTINVDKKPHSLYNESMKNFLFEAIKRLREREIDFIVCGGVANVLHGSDRNTMDLDIYVDLNEHNLAKLIEVSKEQCWMPRAPEPIENLLITEKRNQWIEEKNARVFTLQSEEGLLQIDIFLHYPIPFSQLNADADVFQVQGLDFKVSSIPHLLKVKRMIEPKRRNDIYDIEILEELNNEKKQ
jgi:hypothetical protein